MNGNLKKSLRSLASVLCRILLACMISMGILGMPATTALADVPRCGSITVNETWTAANNNYIITCDVTVNAGVTLTIEPDVVVKFDPGTSLQVDGELVAEGCTFTSNATTPAKGDWERIYFTSSSVDAQFDADGDYLSGSKIEDCLIEWGGGYLAPDIEGAIHAESASPYIYSNIIRNNTRAIMADGRSSIVPIVISQNQINNNEPYAYNYGGGIYVSLSTLISNTVTANHATFVGGIYATSSTITGNTISGNGDIGATGAGGIHAEDSRIENNLISSNTAYECGGINALGNSEIINNIVRDNSGATGGVCVDSGIVFGNTIFGNSAWSNGGGIRANNATIENNTVHHNSAYSGGGIHAHTSILTNNNIYENSATTQGGGLYLWEDFTATGNTISGNSAADGGGAYLTSFWALGNLTGNTIENNTANKGGGVYALTTTVRGNTVISNTATSDGGGVYAEGSTVEDNTFTGNTIPGYGHGSGAYLKAVTQFSYNTVISNTTTGGTSGGISTEGVSEFHYNNLYANQPYDAEVISSDPVTGTLNYWGETLCLDIPARIYDGNDAPGRGELAYSPSLYAPVPLAQLSSPTSLELTTITTGTIELSWSEIPAIPLVGCRPANTPDSGYRVYYDSDAACAPFDGDGLIEGASPIDTGGASSITLNGLGSGVTYFVVTAYDYLGRESTYSNVVQIGTGGNDNWIFLPMISN